MADLTDTISGNATNPNQATSDGHTVVQNRLTEVIAADRYLKAATAATKKNRGLRFSKILPAGAMSDCQGTRQGTASFDQPGIF